MNSHRSAGRHIILQDLFISISAGTVDDETWKDYIRCLQLPAVAKHIGASVGKTEVSSVQRKEAAEILKRRGIRVAAVTDDTLVRGLVTAISWLGANISAFSWTNARDALKDLGITGTAADMAYQALVKGRAEIEAEVARKR